MSTGKDGSGVTAGQAFLIDPAISPLEKYRRMAVGRDAGWLALLKYEFLTGLLGPLPGMVGYFLRQKLYPALFSSIGPGATLGRSISVRQPGAITLGSRVYVEDNVQLDARDGEIVIGDGTFVGRGAAIKTKGGRIEIGPGCNIGAGVMLGTRSLLVLEEHVLIAANCNVGAGNHRHDRLDVPVIAQGMEEPRDTFLRRGVWLGTGVVVADGVSIGADAIVGALSLVRQDVPERAVAAGQPAKVLRYRDGRPL